MKAPGGSIAMASVATVGWKEVLNPVLSLGGWNRMGIRWNKAIPVMAVAFILYAVCIYFMVGCSPRIRAFDNGDPVVPRPEVREVVEPDMPQYGKDNP